MRQLNIETIKKTYTEVSSKNQSELEAKKQQILTKYDKHLNKAVEVIESVLLKKAQEGRDSWVRHLHIDELYKHRLSLKLWQLSRLAIPEKKILTYQLINKLKSKNYRPLTHRGRPRPDIVPGFGIPLF